METNFSKPNPKKILGYLMAFAMVFFTTSFAIAQNAVTITVGGGSYDSEISWDITDAAGGMVASGVAGITSATLTVDGVTCYDMNMYDAYGDGWNGGTYSITDDGDGTVYATGGLTGFVASGTDNFCPAPPPSGTPGCMDPIACNYDTSATFDDGSCSYAAAGFDCAGNCLSGDAVTLNLYDSYGDGWNGGIMTVNGVDYTIATGASASFDLCLDLSACTDLIYTAGSWSSENSWDLTDASGAVLASGANNSGILGNVPGFDCAGACLSGDAVTLNLYDSYGDGWNGNSLTVDGTDYTVATGASASFTLCLDLTACTDIIYTAGSYSSENSWDVVDASGAVIASGANNSGDVGACAVYGCTDPTASNYDAAANTDDGSCVYCADNYVSITCGGGSWASEVSWTLTNSAGVVVLTGGAPYSSDECLADDCYTLDMVDAYGDGWNGNVFDMSMGGVSIGTATITSGATGSADFSVGAICYVYGCTDAAAVNYDAAATADDGSCMYSCTAAPYCENFDGGAGTWTNNGFSNTSGGTPSGSTGPNDDVTGGGFYMYYETSGGGNGGVGASMTSE